MTRQKSVLRQIALRLPEIASFCCAALMLCVIPLYFDDAFFNINRCKVSLIRTATPWLLALMAVSLCVSPASSVKTASGSRPSVIAAEADFAVVSRAKIFIFRVFPFGLHSISILRLSGLSAVLLIVTRRAPSGMKSVIFSHHSAMQMPLSR